MSNLESNVPHRTGQSVAWGRGQGLGIPSKLNCPIKIQDPELGSVEEKGVIYFSSGPDHLHCGDCGHKGSLLSVLVTQVSSVV